MRQTCAFYLNNCLCLKIIFNANNPAEDFSDERQAVHRFSAIKLTEDNILEKIYITNQTNLILLNSKKA